MSLSVRTIRSIVKAQTPGMWAHKRGLYLVVSPSGTPTWGLRYSTNTGKRRLMTLEPYENIDDAKLAALEADAADHRKAIKAGADPLAERDAKVAALATEKAASLTPETFKEAALAYIEANKGGWKNPKHRQQWVNTLATFVYPIIGNKLPHEITMDDVRRVLQQPHARGGNTATLWTGARETANRVRSRIEIVINAAKAKAIAENGNPERQALWRNHHNPADKNALRFAGLNGKQIKSNFKAMDFKEVPIFMTELLAKPDYSAKALVITITCAVRSNEAINAKWTEFDLDNATWIVPAERMKAGKEHRVPLSTVAMALLNNLPRLHGNPYVFPGAKRERPLSNMAMLEMLRGMREGTGLTVHGFRSSFRDWIAETTLHSDAIAEQALAHTIDNKTERAYRRGDAFERRKELMQQWADYLTIDHNEYRKRWSKLIAI